MHFNRLDLFARDNGEAQVMELGPPAKEMYFDGFLATYSDPAKTRFVVTREDHRDLCTVPGEYSLPHCIARDLRMSRLIAKTFRSVFRSSRRDQEAE